MSSEPAAAFVEVTQRGDRLSCEGFEQPGQDGPVVYVFCPVVSRGTPVTVQVAGTLVSAEGVPVPPVDFTIVPNRESVGPGNCQTVWIKDKTW
ncbi:hypothetical protein AKJ08_1215 [Vulgatibacter incomptus]|uniref:Uncharacterized protein n=1 Tax=Vulgatibacter incomptus TaxID=1391653 RepID=A0A0K1PBB6_9BACT|nr:hypothetical protein AKJ08_1215 [Vulgatibacter incomptus]